MNSLWKCLRSLCAAICTAAFLASCASNRPPGAQANDGTKASAAQWGLTSGAGEVIADPAQHVAFSRMGGHRPTLTMLHFDDSAGVQAMKSLLPQATKIPNRLPLTQDSHLEIRTTPARRITLERCGPKVLCELGANEQFALHLSNLGKYPLEFVVTVDGLSVMDRSPGSLKQRGYVVGAGQSYTVKGWRKNLKECSAFVATNPAKDPTAESLKNAGVLGIAVFASAKPEPPPHSTTAAEMSVAWVAQNQTPN